MSHDQALSKPRRVILSAMHSSHPSALTTTFCIRAGKASIDPIPYHYHAKHTPHYLTEMKCNIVIKKISEKVTSRIEIGDQYNTNTFILPHIPQAIAPMPLEGMEIQMLLKCPPSDV